MALYALSDVGDAFDATRRLLGSASTATWLKLALVTAFIGGTGMSTGSTQYSAGGTGAEPTTVDIGPRVWAIIAAAVVAAIVVGLLLLVVASVFEFVFVECLRTESVRLRAYWRDHWRRGIRLFGFRVFLGLVGIVGAAILAAPVIWAFLSNQPDPGIAALVFVVLLPLFVLFAVVLGIVNGFTTVFVVPIVMLHDGGIVSGWRRLWSSIVANVRQYLAYAVVGFGLTIAAGVLATIATVVLAIALVIPFLIPFAIAAGLFTVSELAGIAAFVVVAIAFAVCLIAIAALVQVPIQTFLRYYALFVLGDIEPEFDAVPDQRAAVR
jgi:hypothetical protein